MESVKDLLTQLAQTRPILINGREHKEIKTNADIPARFRTKLEDLDGALTDHMLSKIDEAAPGIGLEPGLIILYGPFRTGKSTAASNILDAMKHESGDRTIVGGCSVGEPGAPIPCIDTAIAFAKDLVERLYNATGLPEIPTEEEVEKTIVHKDKETGERTVETKMVTKAREQEDIISDMLNGIITYTDATADIAFAVDSISGIATADEIIKAPAMTGGESPKLLGMLTMLNNLCGVLGVYLFGLWNPGDYQGPTPNFSGCTTASVLLSRTGKDEYHSKIVHVRQVDRDKSKYTLVSRSYTDTDFYKITKKEDGPASSIEGSTPPVAEELSYV